MVNVCIKARPKGRPENRPVEDFVVEDHADHVLHAKSSARLNSENRRPNALVAVSCSSMTRRNRITGGRGEA
jgi:hypothetical protein